MTDPATFRGRILAALRVQYPDVCADRGYRLIHPDTGEYYTTDYRHLVATCRMIANFSTGLLIDGPDWCADGIRHGLSFLHSAHRNEDGGYDLLVSESGETIDSTRSAYGHAFVLLAHARALDAGVTDATAGFNEIVQVIEEHFVESNGLIRSDCNPDWTEQEPYRGQNANMHACEAYIAAFEATDEQRYLRRAAEIAQAFTIDLTTNTDGLIWEHYDPSFNHLFSYNNDDPKHQFRPPGYQPGHHIEWAKLLALLDRYSSTIRSETYDWYSIATRLFNAAIEIGWEDDGLIYTVTRGGTSIVEDRYGWALAEAIGAAAALRERAAYHQEPEYKRFTFWQNRFIESSTRFIGPAGVWYEKWDPNAMQLIPPSPPGVEPDYHPIGGWYESWRSLRACAE